MELSSLRAGTVIDRYVVERAIGEGGMATVLLVRHSLLGSVHALKVLTLSSRSIRDRMEQEGRLQAGLSHPNIVAVTDVIDLGGAPGLIMEYVEGPTLDALIQQGPLPLEVADQLAAGILAGVAAAHRHGLVHRDLKPANVLLKPVDGTWVPKVADFGLAKVLGSVDSGGGRTRTGSTMGTPHYMSPEQVRDAKSVGLPSDVFALGAILYELVTGRRAYDGSDLLEIFNAVATARYTPPRKLVADLPERMERAIVAAMQVEPGDRPQTVEALAALWSGGIAPRSGAPFDPARFGPSFGSRGSAGSDPSAPAHTFDADTLPDSVPSGPPAPTGSLERPPAPTSRRSGLVALVGVAAVAVVLVGVVGAVLGLAGVGGAWFLAGRPAEQPVPVRVAAPVPVPVPVPVGGSEPAGASGPKAERATSGSSDGVLPIETAGRSPTGSVAEVTDPGQPTAPTEPASDPATDPASGAAIDPVTGLPIDPGTGAPTDPATGLPTDPSAGAPGADAGATADPAGQEPQFGLIASDDPADRKQGIANLAKRVDDEAILTLDWLVKNEDDSSVKAMAWSAAHGRYRDRHGNVDLLEKIVVYTSAYGREKEALEAVRALRDLCADPELLKLAFEHWSPQVRGAAVDALPQVMARSSRPVPLDRVLEPVLADPDPTVRQKIDKVRAQLR